MRIALVVVGVVLICLAAGGLARYVSTPAFDPAERISRATFAGQARFVGVRVEYHRETVNLTGRVQTSNDKWDARDMVWHRLPSHGVKVRAVLNNIVSDEPDQMPPAPALFDNATAWRLWKGGAR